jgi:hypothetical protein
MIVQARNENIGRSRPPPFLVKLESRYSIREYTKYIDPDIISKVPNFLFLLKVLPFIYLIAMYIPPTGSKRRIIAKSMKGRRVRETLDAKTNCRRKRKGRSSTRKMRMDNTKVYIPKVLFFILMSRIFILLE